MNSNDWSCNDQRSGKLTHRSNAGSRTERSGEPGIDTGACPRAQYSRVVGSRLIKGPMRTGVLFQLADFFERQAITIEQLQSTRYRAMQTGADMLSAQLTIGIPNTTHIAALRDDFLEFCDGLNLDAIMDPMKF